MQKTFFFVLAAAALLLTITTQNAQAQASSETPKVEFGVHYTFLRTNGAGLTDSTSDSGVGGRVTYNVSDGLGLEAEITQFPQGGRFNINNLGGTIDNKKTLGLFGAKYGMRSEKLGIFGKIRPGFLRFSNGNPNLSPVTLGSDTHFALDFGGVFELYPSRLVALRFDVGDTIIRYNSSTLDAAGIGSFTTNNLQISTGVSLRF
jgi:hypothetical protein